MRVGSVRILELSSHSWRLLTLRRFEVSDLSSLTQKVYHSCLLDMKKSDIRESRTFWWRRKNWRRNKFYSVKVVMSGYLTVHCDPWAWLLQHWDQEDKEEWIRMVVSYMLRSSRTERLQWQEMKCISSRDRTSVICSLFFPVIHSSLTILYYTTSLEWLMYDTLG